MPAASWLVLLLCLHCARIYPFTCDFLLTRTELAASSLPSDLRLSPCDPDPVPDSTRPGWTRPTVELIVILIVPFCGSEYLLQRVHNADMKKFGVI